MNRRNYQKELDKILEELERQGRVPRLLLHSCCAPCSSYVLEYLSRYFYITVLYYNPNIYPPSEYRLRVNEQESLLSHMSFAHPVEMVEGSFEPEAFYRAVQGLEGSRRAESGALSAMNCGFCRQLRRQRLGDMIILPPR